METKTNHDYTRRNRFTGESIELTKEEAEKHDENTQLTLGKDLFLKDFDDQLIGVKKDDEKIVEATLPENFPEKELVNKKAKFNCKILSEIGRASCRERV